MLFVDNGQMFIIVPIWLLEKEKLEKVLVKLENLEKTENIFFEWDFYMNVRP